MKPALFIRRLLLLVAMLAVVIGPMSIGLAGSAMASSSATPVKATLSSMPGMGMAQGMPCCPSKLAVKPGCAKGCPLALVCTTSIVVHAHDSHGWSYRMSWLSHRYDLFPASQLTSALIAPPARPPKA